MIKKPKNQKTEKPKKKVLKEEAVVNLQEKIDELKQQDVDNNDFGEVDEVEILTMQLREANEKKARAVADYHNLERRMEQEKQQWIKFGNVGLLTRLLEVTDNLDRAAGFIKDPGLDMVRSDFFKIFEEFGVEEIECVGKEFDPTRMECVEKGEGKENLVTKIRAKGYQLNDRVLRPVKVVVGSGK